MRDTITEAIRVLADITPEFEGAGYTDLGEGYKRVTKYSSAMIKDGAVTLHNLLDLDDLYTLYYLLEPVIEPTMQIATALNSARYAEERGAILVPKDTSSAHRLDHAHEIEDPQISLKGGPEEDTLPRALTNALIDLALNKVDMAGFFARVTSLADHTLTGQLMSPNGELPTYEQLLSGRAQSGTAITTHKEALNDRRDHLIRAIVGLPKDSDIPLIHALEMLVSKIKRPLREHFQAETRRELIELYDRLDALMRMRHEHPGYDPLQEIRDKWRKQSIMTVVSDMVAGRVKKYEFDDNGVLDAGSIHPDIPDNSVAVKSSLVVRDSEVETAIDGISGAYRTKTLGSFLVRYELPRALEKFMPQGARPSPMMTLTLGK